MTRLHPDVIPSNRPRIAVYGIRTGYKAQVTLGTGTTLSAFSLGGREDAIEALEEEILAWASVDLDDYTTPNWDLGETCDWEQETVTLTLHYYEPGGKPNDLSVTARHSKEADDLLRATLACIRDLLLA